MRKEIESLSQAQVTSLLAMPIVRHGQTLGVATFAKRTENKNKRAFNSDEIGIAETFTGLYGIALVGYQRALQSLDIGLLELRTLISKYIPIRPGPCRPTGA